MADTSGEADIRGIDIDKMLKGFADEENVFKKFVTISTTKAREIRWYQKTSGFLDTTDTTGITKTWIQPMAEGALPYVVEQSFTRNTSYVKKFIVESPWITIEDIKDSDVQVFATNVRDLRRGVDRKVDLRIFSVLNECAAATPTVPNPTLVNTTAATADGWNDAVTGNPIKDLLVGKRKIRQQGYNPQGAIVSLNSIEEEFLIDYLINVKGSSVPGFSSELIKQSSIMGMLGLNFLTTENQTTDYVTMWIPKSAATWKKFIPSETAILDDPGIAKKIRTWEEGECILTDPGAVHVTTDTTV
jgi:hypothetical protein